MLLDINIGLLGENGFIIERLYAKKSSRTIMKIMRPNKEKICINEDKEKLYIKSIIYSNLYGFRTEVFNESGKCVYIEELENESLYHFLTRLGFLKDTPLENYFGTIKEKI
ncbi:hypothetical protein Bp8pS_243 [Bacillus phage vB_BpuM-BpSp]|nr:hypothetical protein Bp8pS_243 [Bacillus phage vB_BpuM-BpSp]